jgi:hypothetical protein
MKWALINEQGGWLENIVVWDGNASKWQPPAGMRAVKIEEINLSELPQKPAQTNDEADAVQFLAPPVPEGM